MIIRDPAPRLELISDPNSARRALMTLSATDADSIPKVEGAGSLFEHDGVKVQMMHNGLLIEEGCYYGQYTTEIIRSLHGHHEPQEEAVFYQVIQRLLRDNANPSMIEFGSFWTYYGMWFAQAFPTGRVIAIEPDPQNFEVGIRNAKLNSLENRITFMRGAVGANPGSTFTFNAESDGKPYEVDQYDLRSLMQATGLDHVDLVLVDIQGAETILLDRARGEFAANQVRFMIISTHHNSISGDALTHQRNLRLLQDAGAHVIAEHSVSESVSGDGLIAISFDTGDSDMHVKLTYSRAKDSLFGELEYELDRAFAARDVAQQQFDEASAHVVEFKSQADEAMSQAARLASALADAARERDDLSLQRFEAASQVEARNEQLEAVAAERDEALSESRGAKSQLEILAAALADANRELDAVKRTKVWRWSAPLRKARGSARRS